MAGSSLQLSQADELALAVSLLTPHLEEVVDLLLAKSQMDTLKPVAETEKAEKTVLAEEKQTGKSEEFGDIVKKKQEEKKEEQEKKSKKEGDGRVHLRCVTSTAGKDKEGLPRFHRFKKTAAFSEDDKKISIPFLLDELSLPNGSSGNLSLSRIPNSSWLQLTVDIPGKDGCSAVCIETECKKDRVRNTKINGVPAKEVP